MYFTFPSISVSAALRLPLPAPLRLRLSHLDPASRAMHWHRQHILVVSFNHRWSQYQTHSIILTRFIGNRKRLYSRAYVYNVSSILLVFGGKQTPSEPHYNTFGFSLRLVFRTHLPLAPSRSRSAWQCKLSWVSKSNISSSCGHVRHIHLRTARSSSATPPPTTPVPQIFPASLAAFFSSRSSLRALRRSLLGEL